MKEKIINAQRNTHIDRSLVFVNMLLLRTGSVFRYNRKAIKNIINVIN